MTQYFNTCKKKKKCFDIFSVKDTYNVTLHFCQKGFFGGRIKLLIIAKSIFHFTCMLDYVCSARDVNFIISIAAIVCLQQIFLTTHALYTQLTHAHFVHKVETLAQPIVLQLKNKRMRWNNKLLEMQQQQMPMSTSACVRGLIDIHNSLAKAFLSLIKLRKFLTEETF